MMISCFEACRIRINRTAEDLNRRGYLPGFPLKWFKRGRPPEIVVSFCPLLMAQP
jgi:hypothetical protein